MTSFGAEARRPESRRPVVTVVDSIEAGPE